MDDFKESWLLENSDKIRAFLRGFSDKLNKVWKNSETDDEEAKTLKRYRALLVFSKRIRELANDMIEHCSALIEERRSMMLEDYFYVRKSLDDYGLNVIKRSPPIWTKCIYLIQRNLDDVRIYEKEMHEDIKKFAERIARFVNKFYIELKGDMGDAGDEEKKKLESFKTYLDVLLSFEFRLCWRLVCFPTEPQEGERIDLRYLEQSLNVVCLYIALKNETEELKEYAELNGWKLTEAEPKGKKTKPVTIPHELDTEEGRELLQKVINAGFCDKNYNWDETMWRDGEDLEGLVYFVETANRKLKLQKKQTNGVVYTWKPFDTLFTYRGKTSRKDGKTQLQMIRKNLVRYQTNKKRFDPKKSVKDRIGPLFS